MEYAILRNMFEGENPKSLFEIGVGGGGLLKDAADHFKCTKIGGIDISKVRMKNLETMKGEFIVHDLNDPWPVPDKSYDIVFSVGVLMYMFNPIPIMKEMFRVAKDKVILAEYHHQELDKYGVLTRPFKDKDTIHQGIIRNYIELLSDLGIKMEIKILNQGSDKTIIKCQKLA